MAKIRKMRIFTQKEWERVMTDNGYELRRHNGDHRIYVSKAGRHISIKYPLNPCISRRLIKEYSLTINV